MSRCIVILAVVFFSFSVTAQESQTIDWGIKTLVKGQQAPFTGSLLSEERFEYFTELQNQVEDLEAELRIQKIISQSLEKSYVKNIEEATKPPKFWQTGEFKFWCGVAVGIAATGLAVWSAVEIVKAQK